jgi:uncharacterized protein (UPF0335 family)
MKSTVKKSLFIILIMSTTFELYSQINYYPPKPNTLSEEDYRHGKLILENSYAQIISAKRERELCYLDYWNFAVAYSIMDQPLDTVYNFLLLSKKSDEKSFCQVIEFYENSGEENKFHKKFGHRYKGLAESCKINKTEANEADSFDLLTYAKSGGFDIELVKKLDRMSKLDQKYRAKKYDPFLQTPLDKQNMEELEKVIEKYGYPGKSLVGVRYDYVACAIIQRSNNMEYWDKYLPLISDAVSNGELSDVNHLKMLLDRVYIDKIGAQIFGSKMGVPFADDKTIGEVKLKYKIK